MHYFSMRNMDSMHDVNLDGIFRKPVYNVKRGLGINSDNLSTIILKLVNVMKLINYIERNKDIFQMNTI